MTATEYVILVDEHDNQVGVAPKLHAHEHGLLHRAFSVFIYRTNITATGEQCREWLLQQRAFDKYHSPGLWTNTCCSHPKPNELIWQAAERRLAEEMGLRISLTACGQFKYRAAFDNGLTEHEVDHVFVGVAANDCMIEANPNEVASFRWVETSALIAELATRKDQFTPWFQAAFDIARCA